MAASWWRAAFFRARLESDMEKELRFHLELETENNIRAGMPPDEAKRRALVAFGGVEQTKEAVRDERGTRWLDELAGDLKFAFRGFRRQPAFAIGVVALIALGVGANAAIFSVVHRLLIAPLPYADGNRMVQLTTTAGGGRLYVAPRAEQLGQWRARARSVESITIAQHLGYELGDSARGLTEQIRGIAFGPGATDFVGMRPQYGRDIVAADTLRDAAPVALLSYGLWQRAYGGRTDAIGRTVVLNHESYTVIGVMPERFSFPFVEDPQAFPAWRSGGPDQRVGVMAKLRRGATVDDANRELAAIFSTLDGNASQDAPRVERAIDQVPGDVTRTVLLLFGAVGIVLLIACANVANLLAARAWTRQREFAIRGAIGAGRARLVRQVLVESLTLALTGAAGGIVVAMLTMRLLRAQREIASYLDGVRLEPAVLWWLVGLAVATGLLAGIAPAMFVSTDRACEALKAGNRSFAGNPSAMRLRGALVIGEVALSVVLLVASGLLVRTIVSMQRADVGFRPHGLYGVQIGLSAKQFSDSIARHAIIEQALARVRAVPGIGQVTLAMKIPPDYTNGTGQLEIDGRPVAASDSLSVSDFFIGRPDLFAVSGVRILQGRAFASYDALTDRVGNNEEVVNESFARRFWPNGGAIGARLRRGDGPWTTIVGIANDITVPGAEGRRNAAQFYEAIGGAPRQATIAFQTELPLASIQPAVTAAVQAADSRIKIGKLQSSDDSIAADRGVRGFTLRLIGAFAALALLLAAFGLHATIAYSVSQRTREIGIRVALGAQAGDVMRLVVGQGVVLSLTGIIVGAIGGVLSAQTMRALLYHVVPADPATLAVVSASLIAVGIAASYVPARRAMKVDPVDALRAE